MLTQFIKKDEKWNLTDDFIPTKDIIKLMQDNAINTNNQENNYWNSAYFQLANTLIKVKAIRAQTKALEKNSKSANFLAWVWVIASLIWALYTYLSYIK